MSKTVCRMCREEREDIANGLCPECTEWIEGYEQVLEETIGNGKET